MLHQMTSSSNFPHISPPHTVTNPEVPGHARAKPNNRQENRAGALNHSMAISSKQWCINTNMIGLSEASCLGIIHSPSSFPDWSDAVLGTGKHQIFVLILSL